MPITTFPTRAIDSLGPVKTNEHVVVDQDTEFDADQYTELTRRVIEEIYPALGMSDGSTPGLHADVLELQTEISPIPLELTVGLAANGGAARDFDYFDTGNGVALRQAANYAATLAPRRVLIKVQSGTYVHQLPGTQFYCPSNVEYVADVLPANQDARRSVVILGVPPVAATFAQLDGRLANFEVNGVARGFRFEQHGIAVTSPTGTPHESLWQIITTQNPVTFDLCEFYFRQEAGTYMPIAPIGGYQFTATINDVRFTRCLFDVEIEGNTWYGLRDIEILRYRKHDSYWVTSPAYLTSILEDCTFRYEPNVLVTGDGVTGKSLIYADGGFSMRRVYCYGSFVLDNRGATTTVGAKFAGMFADDVTFDFRDTGWHAQISLIAGAANHDCEWLAPYIRNIRILKSDTRDLTGWLEIVAYYGDGLTFVKTTIVNPLIEAVSIVGTGEVARFQSVISSTAPGYLKHAVVRGHHATDPECQVYINNHYTPPHSVPDRIQHIDGITLDDVHVGRVLIGQNIAGTSAEISRVSITGGSQIGVFETETDMVITDTVDVSADSSVGSWIMDTPFPVGHAARRFVFASAPTATDDADRGHRVGDLADVTGGGFYRCTSASAAAAVWARIDPGGLLPTNADNFTATFAGFGNVDSVSLGANPNCKYTRVGKFCRVEMHVNLDPTAAGVSYFTIGGLPFAPKAESTEKYIGSIASAYYAAVPAGGVWMYGAGGNVVQVNANSPSGSAYDLIVDFTYEVAP